jgi:predicted membrane-bound mannosyltransferase
MTVAKRTRERTRQIAEPSALTLEVALYLIIALMALGLRLYKLDGRPMQAGEAAQALAAWRAAQGLPQDSALGHASPLLFTSNMFLFALFGANDFLARLMPALGGALLVIGPYFLRHRLGRMGALAASFLLAISPSTLFFSRYLGGEIVVAACALVITWGLFSYLDQREPKHLYLVAVALGLALSAGAGTFTFILIVITFGLVLALVNRFSDSSEYWQQISDAWQAARRSDSLLRDCAALLVLVFDLHGFLASPLRSARWHRLILRLAVCLPAASRRPPVVLPYPVATRLRAADPGVRPGGGDLHVETARPPLPFPGLLVGGGVGDLLRRQRAGAGRRAAHRNAAGSAGRNTRWPLAR